MDFFEQNAGLFFVAVAIVGALSGAFGQWVTRRLEARRVKETYKPVSKYDHSV